MNAEPTAPETANAKDHPSAWHWFAWTFAVLFIAYPLSVGPVWWLMDRRVIPTSAGRYLQPIYYPLAQLVQHSDSARNFFDWYHQLWCPPVARF